MRDGEVTRAMRSEKLTKRIILDCDKRLGYELLKMVEDFKHSYQNAGVDKQPGGMLG